MEYGITFYSASIVCSLSANSNPKTSLNEIISMKKAILFFIPVLIILVSSFLSCVKEPDIITKTVIEHDTIVIQLTDTVTVTDFISDTATTFILLRHAETTGGGTNPSLSTAGQARAEELRRILANVPLAAIFASNYNRTLQTAQPTATDKSLIVKTYDPIDQSPIVDDWLNNYKGKTVLVLGHSNTIPDLLNLFLGGTVYANLPDSEYNNLYIATVSEKGSAKILHLKYGN